MALHAACGGSGYGGAGRAGGKLLDLVAADSYCTRWTFAPCVGRADATGASERHVLGDDLRQLDRRPWRPKLASGAPASNASLPPEPTDAAAAQRWPRTHRPVVPEPSAAVEKGSSIAASRTDIAASGAQLGFSPKSLVAGVL